MIFVLDVNDYCELSPVTEILVIFEKCSFFLKNKRCPPLVGFDLFSLKLRPYHYIS